MGSPHRIPQHIQILQRVQDIIRRHCARSPDLLNTNFPLEVHEQIDHRLLPVSAVTQQSQITERFLRTAEFPLALTQLVAKRNEQPAEAFTLVLRQREDARDVVTFRALLFL